MYYVLLHISTIGYICALCLLFLKYFSICMFQQHYNNSNNLIYHFYCANQRVQHDQVSVHYAQNHHKCIK